MSGAELLLFPSTLLATTVTVISVEGGHNDEETSNKCLHTPSLHDEALITSEWQLDSEVDST